MHVDALAEGLEEAGILREMGQDDELDLRIVGRDRGDSRAAAMKAILYAPSLLVANGDVLEVGIPAREAAGRGAGLRVVRMYPARPAAGLGLGVGRGGVGFREGGQGVDVGALELGEGPVPEYQRGHRVEGRELLEHGAVGRIARLGLLSRRELALDEQHFLELLGRGDVELVPDVLPDIGLDRSSSASSSTP